MGSILAHGSIVCREYGIPGVLGVGNGTKRIAHGQTITIDGDAGIVMIHDEDGELVFYASRVQCMDITERDAPREGVGVDGGPKPERI